MLSKKLHEALNAQINAELWSAYLYLSMSMDAEAKGLKGVANWFYIQFQEEQDHARIFMNYILSRDAEVTLRPIAEVRTSWASPLEMFRDTLEHEKKVTALINDLAAIEPVVASQWHPTRNGSLTPQQVTPGSSRRVWWLCENGHAWRAVVSSRTGKQRCGCPICAGRPLDRCTAILSEPPAEPVKISAQTAGSRRKHIL